MLNPDLWKSWKRADALEKKVKKKIGEKYELRANNTASLGTHMDDVRSKDGPGVEKEKEEGPNVQGGAEYKESPKNKVPAEG